MPMPDQTQPHHRALAWRTALAVGLLVALLQGIWVVGLPFQLDDFFILRDPTIGFHAADMYVDEDVPAFMCRIPMWLLWMLAAPFAGEPLTPGAFHVLGLALHGLCAALVVRCLSRFTARRVAQAAGVLSGLAGGAMQAVSWTAAWSSLTYTLFGLLALEALYSARTTATVRAQRVLWCASFGAVACAILSKAPGAVVPGVLGALLLLEHTARRAESHTQRRALFDLSSVGLGALGGWLARATFLGSNELGYFESATPSLGEIIARLPNGLAGLGQALVPWNLDPVFAAQAPLLRQLTGGFVSAPQWALLVFGLPVLTAICFGKRRGLMLALAVALIPAVVPLAMLFEDQVTNVAGRSAYLPLPIALALWCVAASVLIRRLPALGWSIGALGLVTLLDGSLHVARTECAMGRHVQSVLDMLEARRTSEHSSTLLALVADGGFGGIPALGEHVSLAAAPPFVGSSPLHDSAILVARSEAGLAQLLRRGELRADATIQRLDMQPGAPVVLGPLISAPTEAQLVLQPTGEAADGSAFMLAAPVQRAHVGWLEFKVRGPVEDDAHLEVLLQDGGQEHIAGVKSLVTPGGQVRFELDPPAVVFGSESVRGVRLVGFGEIEFSRFRRSGPLGLEAPGVDIERPIAVLASQPPLIPADLPADWTPAQGAPRLELALFDTHGRQTLVYCDSYAEGFRLDRLHEPAQAAPGTAPTMPWAQIAETVLLRRLRDERYRWLKIELTTLLVSPDGRRILARSAPAKGRLVDPETEAASTPH